MGKRDLAGDQQPQAAPGTPAPETTSHHFRWDGRSLTPRTERQALLDAWVDCKEREEAAKAERRRVEDLLLQGLELKEDGVTTVADPLFAVKVTARLDHKVDADRLQELATEAGLEDHLTSLFRWKPEVSVRAWKAADERITRALLPAITTKPGRPSFDITRVVPAEGE